LEQIAALETQIVEVKAQNQNLTDQIKAQQQQTVRNPED
jgi:hypothetical protein